MTNADKPVIGIVTFYNKEEGHGVATTRLGNLFFDIHFDGADRLEVTLADGVFVLRGRPKNGQRRIDVEQKWVVLVAAWIDDKNLRAEVWGLLPNINSDDGWPDAIAVRYRPARKHCRKKRVNTGEA